MKINKNLVDSAMRWVNELDMESLNFLLVELPDFADHYPRRTRSELILAARVQELEEEIENLKN